MSIWEYLALFLSVLFGGAVALVFKGLNKTIVKLVVPFTGAYILGITVLHLLPIVYSDHNHLIGLYILVGFFIQIGLDQFSKGIEHGHIHAPGSSGLQDLNQPDDRTWSPCFLGGYSVECLSSDTSKHASS